MAFRGIFFSIESALVIWELENTFGLLKLSRLKRLEQARAHDEMGIYQVLKT